MEWENGDFIWRAGKYCVPFWASHLYSENTNLCQLESFEDNIHGDKISCYFHLKMLPEFQKYEHFRIQRFISSKICVNRIGLQQKGLKQTKLQHKQTYFFEPICYIYINSWNPKLPTIFSSGDTYEQKVKESSLCSIFVILHEKGWLNRSDIGLAHITLSNKQLFI